MMNPSQPAERSGKRTGGTRDSEGEELAPLPEEPVSRKQGLESQNLDEIILVLELEQIKRLKEEIQREEEKIQRLRLKSQRRKELHKELEQLREMARVHWPKDFK